MVYEICRQIVERGVVAVVDRIFLERGDDSDDLLILVNCLTFYGLMDQCMGFVPEGLRVECRSNVLDKISALAL